MQFNLIANAAGLLLVPVVERHSGGPDHFQGALNAGRVGRIKPFSRQRVQPLKLSICLQCFHFPDGRADISVDFRDRRDAVEQNPDIHPGATNQYRQNSTLMGSRDCRLGVIGPARRGAGLVAVDIAEQLMLYSVHFLIAGARA